MSTLIPIRYGVSRVVKEPGKKNKRQQTNHSAEIPEDFTTSDMLQLVRDKHPGWMLVGWAPQEAKEQVTGCIIIDDPYVATGDSRTHAEKIASTWFNTVLNKRGGTKDDSH